MDYALIVEDHLETQRSLLDFMAQQDMRAEGASTLEAARAALRREKPALALVDLMLPDGNGLMLAAELRAAEVPLVLMTGQANLDSALAGLRAGAVDYLQKPVDLGRLAEIVAGCRTPREARPAADPGQPAIVVPVGTTVDDAYHELMMMTLRHCGGDKKRTAQILGICVKTLYNRLQEAKQQQAMPAHANH